MNQITLRNTTGYIAQFVVRRGQQIIARIPGVAPGARMLIPTEDTYQVIATAVIDGNTYISAPLDVHGACGFLAQVRQVSAQGTYEFDVIETASRNPNQLQFQKTCLSPVTFTITKNGRALQSVVVPDSFEIRSLEIGDTFYIHAVINGVTTDTTVTSNPNAVIVANTDTSDLESGYFTLDEN